MNYEGKKEDNIDDVAQYFKKLLINIVQDLSIDADIMNKLFITKLGLLQNIELTNTINILADNAFKH